MGWLHGVDGTEFRWTPADYPIYFATPSPENRAQHRRKFWCADSGLWAGTQWEPPFMGIFVDELPKCDTQRCGIELEVSVI